VEVYELFIEMNLGLLSAAAIIASLMTFRTQSIIETRRMKSIIFCYGISALSSTMGLVSILTGVGSVVIASPLTGDYIITSFSLASFIVGTELLIITAYHHSS